MKRRIFLGAAALLLSAGPVWADTETLTAAEIEALLSGNTIDGNWAGTVYKQYFADSGATTYVPDGGMADLGKWRVNADENLYESWWTNADWTGYAITRVDGGYAWIDSAGDTHPFTVMEGDQLD